MSERVSSEVLALAPKQKQRDEADPIDQTGQGILALVKQAPNISKENADRAMSVAHRLSLQLRAAEDRIAELQAEVERVAQDRAVRAEQWLLAIKGEIEDKLIAPIEANRREPPVVH
jgi:hypothetical protein